MQNGERTGHVVVVVTSLQEPQLVKTGREGGVEKRRWEREMGEEQGAEGGEEEEEEGRGERSSSCPTSPPGSGSSFLRSRRRCKSYRNHLDRDRKGRG